MEQGLRKVPWSKQEDDILKEYVKNIWTEKLECITKVNWIFSM
jgi:hypothetical protein